MTIQGISSEIFTSPLSGLNASQRGLTFQDKFHLGMLFYLSQLHETILESWETFRDNQKENRVRRESAERSGELRNRQKQADLRKVDMLHASRPRRAIHRYHEIHEGNYVDSNSRQLNLPI